MPSKDKESKTELKGGWQICLNTQSPSESLVLGRADGRFFKVTFNTTRYGQPLLQEAVDADGVAGYVVPIVKQINGVWNVVVTYNERPANDYQEKLLEGARRSVSNDTPFISTDGEAVQLLPGYIYSNSARIAGKLKVGVVDVTAQADFVLPEGAEYLSFAEFFEVSTDALTKAVLGQFMVCVLKLV